MIIPHKKQIGAVLALLSAIAGASGQTLFSDNFDSGSGDSANWNVNTPTGGNNSATFGFDYSTLGIPSAPGSGGTTIGLKLTANSLAGTPATANGLSVSPLGQAFTGNYVLSFNVWQNYTGPAATGGSGSTQLSGAGVLTSGTKAQYMNSTQTSVFFGQTGDGGNGTTTYDYHAFSSGATSATLGYNAASGVFAAGTGTTAIDNANTYYSALGGNTVPSAQTTLFSAQSGVTPAGAPGFRWNTGEIDVVGNTVTYYLDGLLIATVNNVNTLTTDGTDILLMQSDVNGSASTSPNLVVGIFDNITVTQITPEPTTYALGLMGAIGFFFARRRAK